MHILHVLLSSIVTENCTPRQRLRPYLFSDSSLRLARFLSAFISLSISRRRMVCRESSLSADSSSLRTISIVWSGGWSCTGSRSLSLSHPRSLDINFWYVFKSSPHLSNIVSRCRAPFSLSCSHEVCCSRRITSTACALRAAVSLALMLSAMFLLFFLAPALSFGSRNAALSVRAPRWQWIHQHGHLLGGLRRGWLR